MAFMELDITNKQYWYLVDGTCGIEALPEELVGTLPRSALGNWAWRAVPAALADYLESRQCVSVQRIKGYGVRLSAPGFMDCTDWTVYTNKREALQAARELAADDC